MVKIIDVKSCLKGNGFAAIYKGKIVVISSFQRKRRITNLVGGRALVYSICKEFNNLRRPPGRTKIVHRGELIIELVLNPAIYRGIAPLISRPDLDRRVCRVQCISPQPLVVIAQSRLKDPFPRLILLDAKYAPAIIDKIWNQLEVSRALLYIAVRNKIHTDAADYFVFDRMMLPYQVNGLGVQLEIQVWNIACIQRIIIRQICIKLFPVIPFIRIYSFNFTTVAGQVEECAHFVQLVIDRL